MMHQSALERGLLALTGDLGTQLCQIRKTLVDALASSRCDEPSPVQVQAARLAALRALVGAVMRLDRNLRLGYVAVVDAMLEGAPLARLNRRPARYPEVLRQVPPSRRGECRLLSVAAASAAVDSWPLDLPCVLPRLTKPLVAANRGVIIQRGSRKWPGDDDGQVRKEFRDQTYVAVLPDDRMTNLLAPAHDTGLPHLWLTYRGLPKVGKAVRRVLLHEEWGLDPSRFLRAGRVLQPDLVFAEGRERWQGICEPLADSGEPDDPLVLVLPDEVGPVGSPAGPTPPVGSIRRRSESARGDQNACRHPTDHDFVLKEFACGGKKKRYGWRVEWSDRVKEPPANFDLWIGWKYRGPGEAFEGRLNPTDLMGLSEARELWLAFGGQQPPGLAGVVALRELFCEWASSADTKARNLTARFLIEQAMPPGEYGADEPDSLPVLLVRDPPPIRLLRRLWKYYERYEAVRRNWCASPLRFEPTEVMADGTLVGDLYGEEEKDGERVAVRYRRVPKTTWDDLTRRPDPVKFMKQTVIPGCEKDLVPSEVRRGWQAAGDWIIGSPDLGAEL